MLNTKVICVNKKCYLKGSVFDNSGIWYGKVDHIILLWRVKTSFQDVCFFFQWKLATCSRLFIKQL